MNRIKRLLTYAIALHKGGDVEEFVKGEAETDAEFAEKVSEACPRAKEIIVFSEGKAKIRIAEGLFGKTVETLP